MTVINANIDCYVVLFRFFSKHRDKAVKDLFRIQHLHCGEGTELHIHGIVRIVADELHVCPAALFGGFGGGIGEVAAEDAGADEREGDAVQAVIFEDAQGVVVCIEQFLESRGRSAEVGADCVDDVPGVGHVERRRDHGGAIFQGSLVFGARSGQSGDAGLLENHAADPATGPKAIVCCVDDSINRLIGAGCVDQYDFAHRIPHYSFQY